MLITPKPSLSTPIAVPACAVAYISLALTLSSRYWVHQLTDPVDAEVMQVLRALRLETYAAALGDGGFEDLDTLRLATIDDLEHVGLKRGHALKLFNQLNAQRT